MVKYVKVCGIPFAVAMVSLAGHLVSFWVFLSIDIVSIILLYYMAYRCNLDFLRTAICSILFLYLHYVTFVLLFMSSERGLNKPLLDIAAIVLKFMPWVQVGLVGVAVILSLIYSVIRKYAEY